MMIGGGEISFENAIVVAGVDIVFIMHTIPQS
jgi:hypothetical protein